MTVDDHVHKLRQRGARDRLAARERYRLVVEAYQHGVSQRQISCSLGTLSQATIARMLQHVTANPHLLDQTPIEVIDRCAAGEISSHEMMRNLHDLLYAAGAAVSEGEPVTANPSEDWSEIKKALARGLLSGEQFQTLKGRSGELCADG